MKDHISLIRNGRFSRAMVSCLVLGLGCLAGGCDSKPDVGATPAEEPAGIKGMKENIKSQIQLQKGAKGKRQPGGPQR